MYFLSINKIKLDADRTQIAKVIPLHIQWTKKMTVEKRIIQTGKWGDFGGMAIIKAESIAEAEKILGEDPLVQSGLIAVETAQLYPDVEIK
jgi:uncharacterized protein YciI